MLIECCILLLWLWYIYINVTLHHQHLMSTRPISIVHMVFLAHLHHPETERNHSVTEVAQIFHICEHKVKVATLDLV